jgi:hypothetical protein
MTALRRAAAIAGRSVLDVLAIVGLLLVAYGAGQAPAPWGAVLAPVILGLGLLATVRFGSH